MELIFEPGKIPFNTEEISNVTFHSFSLNGEPEGIASAFSIPELNRFLALYLKSIWWMIPGYGDCAGEIPAQTQLLLGRQSDHSYLLLMPLVDRELRATLQGNPQTGKAELFFEGTLKENPQMEGTLLAAAEGSDPFELVLRVVKTVRERFGTFALREEKKMPDFLRCFGWCTWDAFYHTVSEAKIEEGLESFRKGGITPGFMILDDGWQITSQNRECRLVSFDAVPEKFPNGIGGTVKLAKEKYGIRYFGVWHTLAGYWWGIVPSPLLPFKVLENERLAGTNPDGSPKYDHYWMIHPDDIQKFYDAYHEKLKAQGVDLLKVDNQGALGAHFCLGKLGRCTTVGTYLTALQNSSTARFGNALIHCMSNGSDIFFHMKHSNIWRNSDDYFPKRGLSSQHHHLHGNAKNAYLAATFCWPDYDMFQSYNLGAEFHAASRALSGGPVYVCDVPGKQNFEVIRRFCDQNGDLLRPDRPALPSEDCLLVDVQHDHLPLKLTNRSGECGLLGVFNCCDTEPDRFHAFYTPGDIHDLKGDLFAAYSHRERTVKRMARQDSASVELNSEECDIITFAPLENGVAAIGALDKYLPPAIFDQVLHSRNKLSCKVKTGGKIGFYCEHAPEQVLRNGKAIQYTLSDALLIVDFESTEPAELELVFGTAEKEQNTP